MKRFFMMLTVLLMAPLSMFAQGKFKDVRQTYLWDVTLSMKGFNGAPDIYDQVVDVMIKDINSVTNERTEIVVVPFQDSKYCEVWREMATPAGKKALADRIRAYKNEKVTKTNISAPLQYAIDDIFSKDKIDILKLMTDGNDNANPKKLEEILSRWCEIAKEKDAYGYYILLTTAAKNGDLSLVLKGICNFEEIDVSNMLDGIADIRQINAAWDEGILINIRDDYGKEKRLDFIVFGGDGSIPAGFKIRFKTQPNPYVEINEVAEMQSDNSLIIPPKFLQPQKTLSQSLPQYYSDIILEYEPTEEMANGKFAFTRIVDNECNVILENKPVKTVRINVK